MDASRRPALTGSRPGMVLMPQGLFTRGPAFFIDSMLVSSLVMLLLDKQTAMTRLIVVALAAQLAYFALFEGLLGTTPGKRVFRLRVVRAADGRPCGPAAALVRTLLRLVDNLAFSLPGIAAIMSSPLRQRLGDRVAHTLVVTEVPEQLLAALRHIPSARPINPDEFLRSVGTQLGRRVDVPVQAVDPDSGQPSDAQIVDAEEAALPCPFCAEPMRPDEIVCQHCDRYVNQVSAYGDAEDLAPAPLLHSDNRQYRFDALWRLVFAADEASLGAVRDAVREWSQPDRLLAVHAFAEVDDQRVIAFLDLMIHDPDAAVSALARGERARLATRTGEDELG